MSFVNPSFPLFFLAVFVVHYALSWNHRAQSVALILASLAFYGWVDTWMVGLLLSAATLGYVSALGVKRDQDAGGTGNRWLGLVLAGNVGVLATFKYFNFFDRQVTAALTAMGVEAHESTLQLALPIGLSFYTFQTLAYVIDVWRGHAEPKRDPIQYGLFVVFFCQLVAGPINRASQLMPQVESVRRFDADRIASGLGLALWGAVKKIMIADTLSPYVDLIYAQPDPSWAMIWAAALGFTVQVLADFSGYTDLARGSARMLGFELAENFAHPYLANSPMEFWNRWHMSFSIWLRDYVYMPACFSPWVKRWITVPFSGDWSPFWHTARALGLTMLVSGVWHGSTANYVMWGGYYAVLGTAWSWVQSRVPKKVKKSRNWRPFTVPLMFCFTVLGMMIFRESDVPRFFSHLARNPFGGTADQWVVAAGMLSMCLGGALPLLLGLAWEKLVAPRLTTSVWALPVRTTSWAIALIAILTFYRRSNGEFVYFQF